MAKEKSIYTCTECGGTSPKWQGKCPHCGAWNTLVEAVAESGGQAALSHRVASLRPAEAVATLAEIEAADCRAHADRHRRVRPRARRRPRRGRRGADRRRPGHRQVDAAAAGARRACRAQVPVLYVTGEESRRAGGAARAPARPGRGRGAACWPRSSSRRSWPRSTAEQPAVAVDRLDPDALFRGAHLGAGLGGAGARMRGAAHAPRQGERHHASSWSATSPRKARSPGRACSSTWSTPCSTSRATRTRSFRLVRAIKNRFGAVNEIGVFAMTEKGLQGRHQSRARSSCRSTASRCRARCVMVTLEGTRPLLVEVQALVDARRRRARAGSRSASSATAWRCCSRCCTATPASPASTRTCSSTPSAACASASRRPTWR